MHPDENILCMRHCPGGDCKRLHGDAEAVNIYFGNDELLLCQCNDAFGRIYWIVVEML